MVDATLSRGNTSVDIPLIISGSGNPLLSIDVGKPNLDIQNTGNINPRFIDPWSGNEQYTITGRFIGENAFEDAIKLADLIKSNANGENLILDIPLDEIDSNIKVAPGAGMDECLTLTYPPGRKDWVEVDLSLTRINTLLGSYEQPANTPTASGSGPIKLKFRGRSVDLVRDVSVSRRIGRPQSTVRRNPTSKYPNYVDTHKTAIDRFEVSVEFGDSDYLDDITDLVDMFSRQLFRNNLALDFNGVFGMGQIPVVPEGSGALRHNRVSGEKGTKIVPTLQLRRVLAD